MLVRFSCGSMWVMRCLGSCPCPVFTRCRPVNVKDSLAVLVYSSAVHALLPLSGFEDPNEFVDMWVM